MRTISIMIVAAFALNAAPPVVANAGAQEVTSEVPASAPPAPACRQINKGGPIAGIVVGSVFWWVLPMSIPVLITQTRKLKRRRAEIYEQQQRGCP